MSINNSMGTLSPMATLAPTGKGSTRPGDTGQDDTGFATLLQTLGEPDDTPGEQPTQTATDNVSGKDKEPDASATPQVEGLLLTPAWLQVGQLLQGRAPGQPEPGGEGVTGRTDMANPSITGIAIDTVAQTATSKPGDPSVVEGDTSVLAGDAAIRPAVTATATATATVTATAAAPTDETAAPTKPGAIPFEQTDAPPATVLTQVSPRATTPERLRAATAGTPQRPAAPSAQRSGASVNASSGDDPARFIPAPVATSSAMPSPSATTSTGNAAAAVTGRERGPLSGRAATMGETAMALQPLLDAAAQAAATATPAPARPTGPAATGGGEGAWGVHALLAERAAEASAPAPTDTSGPGEASGAQTLTEQIGYWIGKEIQSAHVQIDQDAQDPLRISVSLQGDEAHVRFQVDSPEIRRVLESTTTDLRDLLRTQGLELAGVSIDAASTPDTGARGDAEAGKQGDGQRNDKGAPATAPTLSRQTAAPRLPGNGSHRLDIFV